MAYSKFLIALIIISGIIIIIAGVFIWQHQQESKEDPEVLEQKPVEEEIVVWSAYKNEEYSLDFVYPKEWGKIKIVSESEQSFIFEAENKEIEEIWHHKLSGATLFLVRGEKYGKDELEIQLQGVVETYQDILKIITPDKKIKTAYAIDPYFAKQGGGIVRNSLYVSPNGKYVFMELSAFTFGQPIMINIETGKNILEGTDIWISEPDKDIYWSPDNKTLAVRSTLHVYAGLGTNSVFVSSYNNTDELSEIAVVSSGPQQEIEITEVKFIDNENLFFQFKIRDDIRGYVYNVKTEDLRKQNVQECAEEGEFCGGISGVLCCSGLNCFYDGQYPDSGGICLKADSSCSQACENLGYEYGICEKFAISPEGFELKKEFERTHFGIGFTSDCYISREIVGVSGGCYCYPLNESS